MTFAQSLLLAASAAAFQAGVASEPRALTALHRIVTPEDYPAEAVRNDEQGRVRFRLDIGAKGEVTGCTILESSGSAALDAGTCRILVRRARFAPAKNAAGKAIPGRVENAFTWRLEEGSSKLGVLTGLWVACVVGEAAKLTISAIPTAQVLDEAFSACEPTAARLEAGMTAETSPGTGGAEAMQRFKAETRAMVAEVVDQHRKVLEEADSEVEEAQPEPQSR